MHQEIAATGQVKLIFGGSPLSWSENFISSIRIPSGTACFPNSFSTVDPGNVSAVFGDTPQFSADLSANSGFLCDKAVLFVAAIKKTTYFFAVCWFWLYLGRVASS
jgi:hypothetical protein